MFYTRLFKNGTCFCCGRAQVKNVLVEIIREGRMGEIGFWQLAAAHPERPALIDADGRRHTAGEFLAACHRVAHGLRALGLQPGDTLATVLANEPAMVEVVLAAAEIGVYLV